MTAWIRADGQTTRTLARRRVGRSVFVAEWLPPKLYGRFVLHYGHDHKSGDRSVTLTIRRLEIGWHQ